MVNKTLDIDPPLAVGSVTFHFLIAQLSMWQILKLSCSVSQNRPEFQTILLISKEESIWNYSNYSYRLN